MKTKLITTFILFYCLKSFAQISADCRFAPLVCNHEYDQMDAPSGSGIFANEINSGINCLGNGEQNSAWYRVKIGSEGDFGFSIKPHNMHDDYDWSVFNLTYATCKDIFNDFDLMVSCSFSPVAGPTGPNGGGSPQDKPLIPVQPGEEYVIIVTKFTLNNGGYSLDFLPTTALLLCDTVKPQKEEVSVYPNPSNTNFTVKLGFVSDYTQITIYDMEGKVIMQKEAYFTDNIPIELLAAKGVYHVRVMANDSVVYKRIIKY